MKEILLQMIQQAEAEKNYDLISYAKSIIDKMAITANAPSNWRSIGEEFAKVYDEDSWIYEGLALWNYKN